MKFVNFVYVCITLAKGLPLCNIVVSDFANFTGLYFPHFKIFCFFFNFILFILLFKYYSVYLRKSYSAIISKTYCQDGRSCFTTSGQSEICKDRYGRAHHFSEDRITNFNRWHCRLWLCFGNALAKEKVSPLEY